MTLNDLIQFFGSQAKTARALNTSDQVVSAWKQKGRIPPGRQYEIEILTNGHLRADRAQGVSLANASDSAA
jgi:DNA-binding transcriptional regulator YdaS (Cro superfamily)